MKIILEIKFYFISTFRKITVGGFVNQLIKNAGLIIKTIPGRKTIHDDHISTVQSHKISNYQELKLKGN